MARTVALFSQNVNELTRESPATEAITPGHLIELLAAGVRKHATAGAIAPTMFAVEQDYVGDNMDTAYVVNETVKWIHFPPGSVVNALVAAAAPAIVVGDNFESAGNGTLRKQAAAGANGSVVGKAIDAVDNSAGGAQVRIRCEIA